MLLPSAFQDKDIPLTLGKKIERQEPAKADPFREFERHNHDIPCMAKLPDEYVKEAAKELKRQWEENRAKHQRVDNKAKLGELNKEIDRINALIDQRQKEREQWARERPEWLAWAERVESTLPAWPKIDASAVPVGAPLTPYGQSIYMYGTGDK
jgi:hypothetical protein